MKQTIYFILFTLSFSVHTQMQNTSSTNVENLFLETKNGVILHIKETAEIKNQLLKQLQNLSSPQILKETYKFTNLTPHRALIKYTSTTPFLKKGHELKSGECLLIHTDYFEHLSILWGSELLCGVDESNHKKNKPPCPSTDSILNLISQQQTSIGIPPALNFSELRGYYEFSYVRHLTGNLEEHTPFISFDGPKHLVLLHKESRTLEECKVF